MDKDRIRHLYRLKLQIKHLYRRRMWVLHNISFRKAINLSKMGLSIFFTKKKKVSHLPFAIKVDTTPNCQLKCTACIHGDSSTDFKHKNMSLDIFKKIIADVAGVTSALSLYYLGEPFINKDTIRMIELASRKKITTFVSSNFSFDFSRENIKRIIDSGLTCLTVCLDGMTQDVYERTRVGGKVDYVLDNLKDLQRHKMNENKRFPLVEIQYLKFPHNEHQIPAAKRLASSLKIDHLEIFNGGLTPWLKRELAAKEGGRIREKTFLPKCLWPWISMIVKWDGDVIPCCRYRFDEQYDDDLSKKYTLGNVNHSRIREIWNGEAYQQLREMVVDPSKLSNDEQKKVFCYGCYYLYK